MAATGGAAAARAVDLSPNKDVPAISISVATGGQGGSGNTGGKVRLNNSGLIATAGDVAIGVMAQSIGGGGGTGGDSTAASYSAEARPGLRFRFRWRSAVRRHRGHRRRGEDHECGVDGALGAGCLWRFRSKLGGGGGTGGGGDASFAAGKANSVSASIAVGGTGGTGGDADTLQPGQQRRGDHSGDGSDGGVCPSVAGWRRRRWRRRDGRWRHDIVAVGVGGSGGAGGNGNIATVANGGSIVTRGTDAIGLSVQSIGGGGGTGGKGGATAGGAAVVSNAQALFDILANGLGLNQDRDETRRRHSADRQYRRAVPGDGRRTGGNLLPAAVG